MTDSTPAQLAAEAAAQEAREACAKLSPRYREVLVLISTGLTAKEVAAAMGLTDGSVEKYARRIVKTLGVRRMIEAAVIATKAGLV